MNGLRFLFREMVPFWPRVLLALLLSTLAVSSHIGLMATASYLLARAALHPPVLDLMTAIVGVRFFGISRAVFRYLERLVSHDLTFRVLSRIRVKIYQGLEPLASARLKAFRSGDLLSRIVGDVEIQQNLFLRVLAPPLVALFVLLVYGSFIAGYDRRFAYLLAAFFLAAGVGLPMGIKSLSRHSGQQRIRKKAELHISIMDLIQGMPELLAFGKQKFFMDKVNSIQNELIKAERKDAGLSGLSNALMSLFMNLGMGAVLVLGIVLVESQHLNGLYLGMLVLGTLSSFEAVLPLPSALKHLEENKAAGERLWEVVQESSDVRDSNHAFEEIQGMGIEIRDLCFRYHDNEAWVLNKVSLQVPENGKIGIVGPSGSGKSSLVNVLLRLWDYSDGEVRLGGQNLKNLSQEDVRSRIGVVSQKNYLFHATVKENLLLAKPDASDEELFEAARQAKIHDFVLSLPQGYDSVIGEEGMKFSGGQRQRLAIARVLLKNAPILILDEATTGLDPVTENEVMKEINALMEGRTTLIITHHLPTVTRMDQILVFNKGKIVEQGTHQEMIKRETLYKKLWDISKASQIWEEIK